MYVSSPIRGKKKTLFLSMCFDLVFRKYGYHMGSAHWR